MRNFSHGVQDIPATVHPWTEGILTKSITGHCASLLRPSMVPGFSYQAFVTGFAKNEAGVSP